jgi:predicted transcriptional regulator
MSQTQIGKRIGVSFQQVQKYEMGTNRIGCSRLVRIADVLQVPLLTLFKGVQGVDRRAAAPSPSRLIADSVSVRLLQAFAEVKDVRLRRSIANLVSELAHPAPSGVARGREFSP